MPERVYKKDSKAIRLTILSIIVSLINFALKFGAYFITHSVAILSDATESIVNIISATMAFIGTKIALKPPDEEHPYGHTKIEYIFSIIEALFIIAAGASIFWEALKSLSERKPFHSFEEGAVVIGITIVLNACIAGVLYYQGKKERSPILISHGSHIFADVLTSLGVILGLALAKWTGIFVLDPVIAILIGLHILKMGFSIVLESGSSLLDQSLPNETVQEIRRTVEDLVKNSCYQDIVYEIANFKTRKAGRTGFVEFDVVLPPKLPLETACRIRACMEKEVKKRFPELVVSVHIRAKET